MAGMGDMFGQIAGAAGGLISGVLNMTEQQDTNSQQRQMFDSSQQFNELEAQKNRDFQMQMSNTAHQREVKDLQAAGLNPILSGTGGSGSSSPSGTAASSPGIPSLAAPQLHLPDFLGYGISLKQLDQRDRELQMQQQKTDADVGQATASTAKTKQDIQLGKKGLAAGTLGQEANEFLLNTIRMMKTGVLRPPSPSNPKSGNGIPISPPEAIPNTFNSPNGLPSGGIQ